MVDWSKLEVVKTEADHAEEAKVVESLAYLKETNWYTMRYMEEGVPIPEAILAKRIAARITAYPEAL